MEFNFLWQLKSHTSSMFLTLKQPGGIPRVIYTKLQHQNRKITKTNLDWRVSTSPIYHRAINVQNIYIF